MRHRHPILNGYSGFKSALQEWLGGPSSPLIEPGELGDTLRGLRAIGVRYVLLHDATFPTERDAGTLAERIRSTPGTIVEEHRFGGTWAWRLADAPPAPASQAFTLVDLKSVVADASQQRSRLEFLVDGDLDTRWVSGGPQNGGEWLELRFDHPIDVARIALVTGVLRWTSICHRILALPSASARPPRAIGGGRFTNCGFGSGDFGPFTHTV